MARIGGMSKEQIKDIKNLVRVLDNSLARVSVLPPEEQQKARKKWQKLIKAASAQGSEPEGEPNGEPNGE